MLSLSVLVTHTPTDIAQCVPFPDSARKLVARTQSRPRKYQHGEVMYLDSPGGPFWVHVFSLLLIIFLVTYIPYPPVPLICLEDGRKKVVLPLSLK